MNWRWSVPSRPGTAQAGALVDAYGVCANPDLAAFLTDISVQVTSAFCAFFFRQAASLIQIGEDESVARHDLAGVNRHRQAKHRPGIGKGVELTALATGIGPVG
jgi:hypothetical protein